MNFRLDVVNVESSRSDSFSRIWSHGERERESLGGGGGGSGQRLNRTYRWREPRFRMPNDMHAGWRQAGLERELKCKSEESDKAHRIEYRPAVSIRLSRSLGFPTCRFLASALCGPHERRARASRKEQLSSLFFVA